MSIKPKPRKPLVRKTVWQRPVKQVAQQFQFTLSEEKKNAVPSRLQFRSIGSTDPFEIIKNIKNVPCSQEVSPVQRGSGNTLVDKRKDQNNSKWSVRQAQSRRSIYQ